MQPRECKTNSVLVGDARVCGVGLLNGLDFRAHHLYPLLDDLLPSLAGIGAHPYDDQFCERRPDDAGAGLYQRYFRPQNPNCVFSI